MGSRKESSKMCGDSLEWSPGTSCPVPIPPFVGPGGSGTLLCLSQGLSSSAWVQYAEYGLRLGAGIDCSKNRRTVKTVSLEYGASEKFFFPRGRVGYPTDTLDITGSGPVGIS